MSNEITRPQNGSTDEKLDQIISMVRSLDTKVEGIDSRLSPVESTVQGIDSRLAALEIKVDQRMHETQPIWERALAEIAELRNDMKLGLRKVERQIMQLSKEFLEFQADQVMIEDRLAKLEGDSV